MNDGEAIGLSIGTQIQNEPQRKLYTFYKMDWSLRKKKKKKKKGSLLKCKT